MCTKSSEPGARVGTPPGRGWARTLLRVPRGRRASQRAGAALSRRARRTCRWQDHADCCHAACPVRPLQTVAECPAAVLFPFLGWDELPAQGQWTGRITGPPITLDVDLVVTTEDREVDDRGWEPDRIHLSPGSRVPSSWKTFPRWFTKAVRTSPHCCGSRHTRCRRPGTARANSSRRSASRPPGQATLCRP